MANEGLNSDIDPEVAAISAVHAALKVLDPAARSRVLEYVSSMLAIPLSQSQHGNGSNSEKGGKESAMADERKNKSESQVPPPSERDVEEVDEDTSPVSPVAKRWIRRNGIDAARLEELFSLGIDDIDLIAKAVPGSSKKEKMQNVFLLKGIASLLSNGAARFTHEQVREACLHYSSWDADNFSNYLKGFSSNVTGSKEKGYSLTTRGLSAATQLVKGMTVASAKPEK